MKWTQNGFSLLEILAVLVITSAVIIPLLRTLYGNFEVNDRVQTRRDATSIADGSLYSIQKIDFQDFQDQLTTANGNSTYFVEFNQTTCNTLSTQADIDICSAVFSTIWNNLSFDETEFKIYMFNYALTTTQFNSITSNGSIEQGARTAILNDADIDATLDTTNIPELIRVVVWIDYYDEPELELTLSGLISDD